VESDTQAGPLDEWVKNSRAKNKEQFSGYNFQSEGEEPFETTSGIKGIRAAFTLTASGNNIQFIDYFFQGGSDAKIVVTCSCSQPDGKRYTSIFDTILKTFVPK
jgi:hypothetical protein